MKKRTEFDLMLFFGNLNLKEQIALIEPFLRTQEIVARYFAKEFGPLLEIAQSQEYQAMMRHFANRYVNFMTAADWLRLANPDQGVNPSYRKPKRILGFLGGSTKSAAF